MWRRVSALALAFFLACSGSPTIGDTGLDADVGDGPVSMDATTDTGPYDFLQGSPAPIVPCGPEVEAELGVDPCAHWVACMSDDDAATWAWAVTFSNGACEAGECTFRNAPVLIRCPTSCFEEGPTGRCANPGPTAL